MLDYARAVKDEKFAGLVASKVGDFFLGDKNCPLPYEPPGEDFLSPCLAAADVARRVLLHVTLPDGCELSSRRFSYPPVVGGNRQSRSYARFLAKMDAA